MKQQELSMSKPIDLKRNKKVGLQGWLCPRMGKRFPVEFDYCALECEDPCMSLPILLALSRNRGVEDGVYSVTEILNPPQQVYLQRNNPYYVTVESQIWMTLGTAWHKVMDDGFAMMDAETRKDYEAEHECAFEIDFGFAKLRGRPDQYEISTKTLRDFKTMKVYSAKKLKAGEWEDSAYPWQMNIYRVFKYRDAEKMLLDCIIKDWNMNARDKDGVSPMEVIQVPFFDDAKVEAKTQQLLATHVAAQNGTAPPRDCLESEVWINPNPRSKSFGVPVRCRDYCSVVEICPQAQRWLKTYGGWSREKNTKTSTPTKRS